MSNILIGKKWDKGAIYIGRGSVFGNPWPIDETNPERTRDKVCDLYEEYFHQKIANDPEFKQKVDDLVMASLYTPITLGCYCVPHRCHGETIKRYIDARNA